MKLYALQEDITSATKKARAVCFDKLIQYIDLHRRECVGEEDEQSETTISRRSTRARKRNFMSAFIYYDDWKVIMKIAVSSKAHLTNCPNP